MKGRVAASVIVWVAAVASVAGIASVAINTAGRQVTSTPLSAPMATEFPASASPSVGPATPDGTRKESSHPSPGPSSSGSGDSAGAPTSSANVAVASTYSTAGGRVRARCASAGITLDGGFVQPSAGWAARVDAAGPQRVLVVFSLANQQALLVVADCLNGSPTFDQERIEQGAPSSSG